MSILDVEVLEACFCKAINMHRPKGGNEKEESSSGFDNVHTGTLSGVCVCVCV
jgi:hypothetical protein